MNTPRIKIVEGDGYYVEQVVNTEFQNALPDEEEVEIVGYNFQAADNMHPVGQHGILLLITEKEDSK